MTETPFAETFRCPHRPEGVEALDSYTDTYACRHCGAVRGEDGLHPAPGPLPEPPKRPKK